MSFDENLHERLKQAEMAEREVMRLQTLAGEAPHLREQRAHAQKEEDRRRAKEQSLNQARNSIQASLDLQKKMPELLGNSGRAVMDLYNALKELDAHRRKAKEALTLSDRIDYEIELEEGEEQERAMDRDPRGLAFALAARHGDSKVKQMLEELDPGFTLLRGCNLDDPLHRDIANFVVRHALPKEAAPTAVLNTNDIPPSRIIPPPGTPQPATVGD